MIYKNLIEIKHKIKPLCFILAVILLCSTLLVGCSSDTYNIYFGVNEMPKNIDPQKAQLQAELLTVRNCFRGLYKLDENGKAVPDLAQNTVISDDGLTYTFTLFETTWKDETPVTADDFMFAIERASDPMTNAPSNHPITNIQGVPERLSGDSSAVLGAKALDTKTLSISLIKPDKNFLSKLTMAIFMPCNRVFFENCKGKYGLNRQNILTNGRYSPSQWTEGRHLKLTLNDKTDETKPLNVYLTVSSTGKSNVQRIKSDEIGITVDNVNGYQGINENEFTINTLYQKNYCLVFNKATEVGGNKQLTDAFARAVHRELFKVNMDHRLLLADTCLPRDSLVFDRTLGNFSQPKYTFELDTEAARNYFLAAVKELKNKKLPSISVLCVENDEIKSILNSVVSGWQNNLGAYVNITTLKSEQALLDSVKNGDFTVALVPLSGSATDVLSSFADANSGMYIGNPDYDNAFAELLATDDHNVALASISKCLNVLSTESAVIPITSTPTAYIYNSDYQNVHFSVLDGTVDFSIIYKNQ